MLTALFKTTPASPRIKPYMMKEKAVRSPAILSFVFILPSMLQLCYESNWDENAVFLAFVSLF
jgi:hypothetical protein